MFHEFPYTNFSEMNLDWLVCMCRQNQGLHLAVVGDYLRLLNADNEVISSVQVSYAEKALTDVHGRDIDAYIFSAGTNGDAIVFTHGDNTITSIVVPYSEKSKYDINNNEITDYVLQVQVAGQKLRITKGDGTIAEITVPFATQSLQDTEGNDIKTYACELAVDGNKLVLRDRAGRVLNEVVPNYAVSASKDEDGDVIADTYATTLDTGTTTVVLKNKSGATLSTITVPYATEAGHTPNADLATLATDCTNAVESVVVSGDQIIFTTYGGTQTAITSPYSVKSLKDSLGNEIKSTYVANVTQDVNTGALNFIDAEGHTIVTLVPTVDKAIHDSYNNVIADYVKQILVDSQSNYVTVTHGTGAVETLIINYATHALNDINEQAIHNTYITYIECIEDVNDGHYKLVCYNGDIPKAELFRFEVTAYSAQTDINGKDLTTYVADVGYNANQEIEVKDGNGNLLNTLRNALDDLSDVETNQLLTAGDLLGYDGTDWTNVELQVALDDLTDVTIDDTTLADGDLLTYDANAGEWVNKEKPSYSLDDLTDLAIDNNTLDDGDLLTYDANTNKWVNAEKPSYAMSEITDVDLTNVQDGDTVVYDSNTNEFVTTQLPTEFDVYELYYNAEETYVEAAISSGITSTHFDAIMEYIGQNYYGGTNQVQMTLSKIANITKGTNNNSPSVSDLQYALAHGVCTIVLRQTYNGGANGNDLRIGTCNSGDYLRNTTLNADSVGMYNIHGDSSNLYVTVDVVPMGGGSSTLTIEFSEMYSDLNNVAEGGNVTWVATSTHSFADLLAAGKDVMIALDGGTSIWLPTYVKDANNEWGGHFVRMDVNSFPARIQFFNIFTTDGEHFTLWNVKTI